MPSLIPHEDENFGGSLVFDFRKRWRHVKTIYREDGNACLVLKAWHKHTGTMRVLGPGFWGTRRLAKLAAGYSNPWPQNASLSLCVSSTKSGPRIFFYWRNAALIYYGPWKKKINRTKPKKAETNRRFKTKRNAICISIPQKGQKNEMSVPEHVVDFMKNMNPQQRARRFWPPEFRHSVQNQLHTV